MRKAVQRYRSYNMFTVPEQAEQSVIAYALIRGGRLMSKGVDIVRIKEEVKKGNLRAYVARNTLGEEYIYLKDTQNGETVCIGKVER